MNSQVPEQLPCVGAGTGFNRIQSRLVTFWFCLTFKKQKRLVAYDSLAAESEVNTIKINPFETEIHPSEARSPHHPAGP